MFIIDFRLIVIVIVIVILFVSNVFASPDIVVSIKPIHSIVSNLTEGVTTPKLLLNNNQSAHHSHLKVSQLYLLKHSDLVIFLHPNFEISLAKIISNIDTDKKFIVSSAINNHHNWLSINNMQLFAQSLTNKLIQIDPDNQLIYMANLVNTRQMLNKLQQNIYQKLSINTNNKVASYSNVFDYFIKENQLNQSVKMNAKHEERFSVFKLLKLKRMIKDSQTNCLLVTTKVPIKMRNTLTEGLMINIASIDVIGNNIKPGAHHYFKLMNNIANQVNQCLQ